MMPQYDFRSPGGDAAETLVALLTKQEAERRQKMIDAMNAENVKSQIKSRESEDAARVKETARLDAAQVATQRNQELTRESAIAEQIPKGTKLTPELEAAMPTLAPVLSTTEYGHMDPAQGQGPTKDQVFGGTTKQQQTDEAMAMRAAIAQMAQENKEQQLEIQRAVMEGRINDQMGRLAIMQSNAELREKMADMDIALKQQKVAAADKTKNDMATGVKNQRYELRTLISSIKDNPDLNSVFGPIQGRTKSVRGSAVKLDSDIARLMSMLTLKGRDQLKGSGAISDWEGRTVGTGESSLNQTGSPDVGRAELERLLDLFQGDVPQGYEEYTARKAAAAGAPPAGGPALTPQQRIEQARIRARGGR